MRTQTLIPRLAVLASLFVILFPSRICAQDTESKPALSEEIRTVLERDGAEAATRRFDAIYPSQRDKYDVDQKRLAEFAVELMQGGDYPAGQAVMQMVSKIVQQSVAEVELDMPEVPPTPEARPEKPAKEKSVDTRPDRGPSRSDLERFTGVYGTPENVEAGRTLFVAETCDGYLVSGAMWGDASNWWLTTEGDNVFDFESGFMSVRMEFPLNSDGNAAEMVHNLEFMDNPLPKVGPLPDGWDECVMPPGG